MRLRGIPRSVYRLLVVVWLALTSAGFRRDMKAWVWQVRRCDECLIADDPHCEMHRRKLHDVFEHHR